MNNYIMLIEDGSVDLDDLDEKIGELGQSKSGSVLPIVYRQGAAKPELVCISECDGIDTKISSEKEIEDTKKMVRDYILNELSVFMNANTERHVYSDSVHMGVNSAIKYYGTADDFLQKFEEQINKGLNLIDKKEK